MKTIKQSSKTSQKGIKKAKMLVVGRRDTPLETIGGLILLY